MEEVCARENLEKAWKRVRSNKGGPGVDAMTIDDAKAHLREHWPNIRSQLLEGTYQPLPVKRVEIPKPDGGVRKLGVPCVVDRLVQQALLQVLQERWDPTFSEHSFGFRPGRSAHQAVAQAQRYIAEGFSVVVDLDLEKFFDRVNHDSLMARVAARVSDKRVLKLARAFLKAVVMEGGLVRPIDEGTPQGGPLSPLLSNLVLDDLDRELTRRGHRFCRYADDCNIYVRSRRAGERVMASVSQFLTQKLRLKVAIYRRANTSKPAPGHKIYPYLPRGVKVEKANQAWATDITYIPMARGFVYLAAVVDWFSRRVLSWRVSISMEADFCIEALEEALAKHGKPEIFNTDQGSQFTSVDFTGVLKKNGVAISMDGKGSWRDNVFVERLWRSVKYEEVYLRAYDSVADARASLGRYLDSYNRQRPHSSLDRRTPNEAYFASQSLTAAA